VDIDQIKKNLANWHSYSSINYHWTSSHSGFRLPVITDIY